MRSCEEKSFLFIDEISEFRLDISCSLLLAVSLQKLEVRGQRSDGVAFPFPVRLIMLCAYKVILYAANHLALCSLLSRGAE